MQLLSDVQGWLALQAHPRPVTQGFSPLATRALRPCPVRHVCTGFWHSHPRSALFHACPNVAACTPPDGGKKLLAYQQLNKHAGLSGWHANRAVDSETYMRAQCATGRSGPLCSTCSAGYGLGPGNVCRCDGKHAQPPFRERQLRRAGS
jgi:hypothetical protein